MISSPDLFSDEVRHALRRDAFDLFFGAILIAAGLLCIALYSLRRRAAGSAVLLSGIAILLYGARMLVLGGIFWFVTEPSPKALWLYIASAITYAMPAVGTLLLASFFPGRWRSFRWFFWIAAVFFAAGVAADLFTHRPESLKLANHIVSIAFVLLVAYMLRSNPSPELRPIRIGGGIFVAAVILNNILDSNFSGAPFARYLEPLGLLCAIFGLGAVIVRRIIAREEQLIAINKELDIARRIQTSILPREAPRMDGVSIATRYVSMTAVAGDFYDFLHAANGIGILIADVSGHGVPAALIASMVKVAAAAQLSHAADPAAVLSGINRVLCGNLQGQFVTAGYLFIDRLAGRMRYAGAGHPPLLVATHADVEAIAENGLILGAFPFAAYSTCERPLVSRSRLLLYTDGIVEASNQADEFFGEDRLRRSVVDCESANGEQCASTLLQRVSAFTGNRQQDDLTLIVVDVA